MESLGCKKCHLQLCSVVASLMMPRGIREIQAPNAMIETKYCKKFFLPSKFQLQPSDPPAANLQGSHRITKLPCVPAWGQSHLSHWALNRAGSCQQDAHFGLFQACWNCPAWPCGGKADGEADVNLLLQHGRKLGLLKKQVPAS